MRFEQLSRDQIIQLKQAILCEWAMDEDGFGSPSWEELANADELVSDKNVQEAFGGCIFSEDDFS